MSIQRVREFADKFDLPREPKPALISAQEFNFRHARLAEELEELYDAFLLEDVVGCFDALLDLAYVTYGTALRLGISAEQWERGFAAVHEANMAKIKVSHVEASRFANKHDIVKPAGWVGPEAALQKILED